MADDGQVENANQLNSIQESINKNLETSNRFYEAALNASGKQQEALESIAGLYDKIAKQEQQMLETAQQANELRKKTKELLREQQKLEFEMHKAQAKGDKEAIAANERKIQQNKMELDQTRQSMNERSKELGKLKQEFEMVNKQIAQMKDSGGIVSGIWSKMKVNLVTALVSAESLRRALGAVLQVSKDVADIAILSGKYTGMENTDGLVETGKQFANNAIHIAKYTANLSGAQLQLKAFGFSAEEARAAFKDFSQVAGGNSDMMGAMTKAAGGLSRMLGVDLSETTDFMIDQNLRFNRTGYQTAKMLQDVQIRTEQMNKGFDRSIINGRDVTKILFDISRESRVLAQDQKAISDLLIRNITRLQGQGATYKEALESAKTFTNVLTKDAPEFLQILSGREVVKQLKNGQSGMMAELEKSAPEIAKRVNDVLNNSDIQEIEKERLINELTSQTKVGLDASMQVLGQTMDVFNAGAVSRIKATLGVTHTQALQIVEQLKSSQGIKDVTKALENLPKGFDKSSKEVQDILDRSGKTFGEKLSVDELMQVEAAKKEDREGVLKNILQEKDLQAAKRAQDDRKAAQQSELNDLRKRLEMAEKGKQTNVAAELRKEIAEKEDEIKSLEKIADDAENKDEKVNLKSYLDKLVGIIENPLAQAAIGIAGLVGLIGMEVAAAMQRQTQINLLTKIAAGRGGGKPPRGAKGLARRAGGLLKRGAGRVLGAGKYLVGGAGSAIMGVQSGAIAATSAAGAATIGAGVLGAGAAGYGVGSAADWAATKWGSSKNKYGQSSNFFEKGMAKANPFLSSEEYQDMYGAPSPVDVSAMTKTTAPNYANVPGAQGMGGGDVTQQAELMPGSQGTDIRLTTIIPISQAMRMNMDTMRRGTGSQNG